MIYVYAHRGHQIEKEFPIGKAPPKVGRYVRVYTAPVIRQLSPMDRGDRPARSWQLPTWYGHGQRETCWKEKMQQLGVEDTPHRRSQVLKAGLGPKPRDIDLRSKEAAYKAGDMESFDRRGRPIARTKRGVGKHLETAKRLGDPLAWD